MSTEPHRTIDAPTVHESPFPVSSDDPTATKTLRNRYGAEMYRRFQALKSAIWEGVVEHDAFGIADLSAEERAGPRTPARFEAAQRRRGGAGPGIQIEPPDSGAFAYPADDRKVAEFLDWLQRETDRGILGTGSARRSVGADGSWQNTYLRQAYSKGVQHADAYLVDAGVIASAQTLDDVFRNVKHADAAGLVFTRAYNELDGVTDAMAHDMGRVLAEGLTRGHNPRKIATDLNNRVENVGLHRARMIARTETIRAHNEATLNRYEDMDARLEGVTTVVEHMTAGDGDVCDECRGLSGRVYTIREARGRIPVHPNCRCTWAPVDASQAAPGAVRGMPTTQRVDEVWESVADQPDDAQVATVSEWLSENTHYGDRGERQTIDLSGLAPEQARAISNVMAKMEDGGYLDEVVTLSRHPDTPAIMRARNLGRRNAPVAAAQGPKVTFNSALYNREELAEHIDSGWITGRFYDGPFDPLESAVVHEFGHVYHLNNVYDNPRLFQQYMNGRFYDRARKDAIAGRISRYAATQPAEFVAESFVRLAYDMPISDDLLALYVRFGGPDPDRYRGFMLDDDVTGNMADDAAANADDAAANADDVDYPDDMPESLRAEAEIVRASHREIYEARYGELEDE